jgi:arsenite methyltransferase
LELWAGCVAGALNEQEYMILLTGAGFHNVSIQATRVYGTDDARQFLSGAGLNVEHLGDSDRWRIHERLCPGKKPVTL